MNFAYCHRREVFQFTLAIAIILVPVYMDAVNSRELSTPEYWEKRYSSAKEGASHEWFRSFLKLQNFLGRHISNPQDKEYYSILHLGCGDSVCILPQAQRDSYRRPAHASQCDTIVALVLWTWILPGKG